jgi:hypothetical protein
VLYEVVFAAESTWNGVAALAGAVVVVFDMLRCWVQGAAEGAVDSVCGG